MISSVSSSPWSPLCSFVCFRVVCFAQSSAVWGQRTTDLHTHTPITAICSILYALFWFCAAILFFSSSSHPARACYRRFVYSHRRAFLSLLVFRCFRLLKFINRMIDQSTVPIIDCSKTVIFDSLWSLWETKAPSNQSWPPCVPTDNGGVTVVVGRRVVCFRQLRPTLRPERTWFLFSLDLIRFYWFC